MAYSDSYFKPHIDNTCAKCHKTFDKWSQYYDHVTLFDCAKPRQMAPVSNKRNLIGVKEPLTDERKREVVEAWEMRQKQGVII